MKSMAVHAKEYRPAATITSKTKKKMGRLWGDMPGFQRDHIQNAQFLKKKKKSKHAKK